MNYLPRNRSRNPALKRITIMLALLIVGAVLFSIFKPFILGALSPVWNAENAFSQRLRSVGAYLSTQRSLREENSILKERLMELEAERALFDQERRDKEILMSLAGLRGEASLLTAAVLTHPPQTPYDTILIDLGDEDLVSVGSEVFLPEGPAIGLVSEVFGGTARVTLFSAPGERTSGVLERTGDAVTLVGAGGGNFKINVPRDVETVVGDKILVPGIPSRLLAVVGDVNLNSTDSFKEVLARSPLNIFALRFLFINP